MKNITRFFLLFTLSVLSHQGFSQTYSKTIHIEEDGDKSTVTITTKENGKSETVVLEGEEADEYIAQKEKGNRTTRINISKEDIKQLEEELESVTVEVEEMFLEIDEFEIDAALNELERVVIKTTNCLKSELEEAY